MRLLTLLAFFMFASGPANCADPPIRFAADLSSDEQSVTTLSNGTGRADFELDRDTLRFSWKVTYVNLTSPLQETGVHGPQRPGTNAPRQFELSPKGAKSPIAGSVVLTEAQLQYLLSDRMYVNLTTTKYPAGELRGQIHRIPPAVTN